MPWEPAPYDEALCHAMHALSTGKANDGQQVMALRWIVETVCGYYDLSFRPGPDGERATAFSEGKRAVAAQIVKLTRPDTAAAVKASAERKREAKKNARNDE